MERRRPENTCTTTRQYVFIQTLFTHVPGPSMSWSQGVSILRHLGPALGDGGPGKEKPPGAVGVTGTGSADGEAGLLVTLDFLSCVRIKWDGASGSIRLWRLTVQSAHMERHCVPDTGAAIKPALISPSPNGVPDPGGEADVKLLPPPYNKAIRALLGAVKSRQRGIAKTWQRRSCWRWVLKDKGSSPGRKRW